MRGCVSISPPRAIKLSASSPSSAKRPGCTGSLFSATMHPLWLRPKSWSLDKCSPALPLAASQSEATETGVPFLPGFHMAPLTSSVIQWFPLATRRRGCSSPPQRRGFPPRVKKGPASKDADYSKSGCGTRDVNRAVSYLNLLGSPPRLIQWWDVPTPAWRLWRIGGQRFDPLSIADHMDECRVLPQIEMLRHESENKDML